jgi:hypothetical protein
MSFLFLFHFGRTGFGLRVLYCLRHTSSAFFSGYFGVRVSQTICQGWSQTAVFLISVSQVARITSVSHLCPASRSFFIFLAVLRIKPTALHVLDKCFTTELYLSLPFFFYLYQSLQRTINFIDFFKELVFISLIFCILSELNCLPSFLSKR